MAAADVQSALAEVELLRGLGDPVLRRLATTVRCRTWRPGEVLFAQGTPGGSLLVLTSGAVTVYRTAPRGDRAALAHLRAPTSVGEVTLLDGSPRTATVEAVEQTTTLELDRADLLELLHAHPAFLDAVLRSLGGLVRRLSDQAADQILLDFAGRVAKTLAGLAGPPPGPHVVRLSQSRLAELAGGTRQSLNQVLGAFASRGWVRVEGRAVVVEDLAALRRRGGLPASAP